MGGGTPPPTPSPARSLRSLGLGRFAPSQRLRPPMFWLITPLPTPIGAWDLFMRGGGYILPVLPESRIHARIPLPPPPFLGSFLGTLLLSSYICVRYTYTSKCHSNIALINVKGRSHYSDNQSPTSNNHYFWGGCRRLSEVGKCLSMIGDWLSENYIDNLSPTSDNHPFSGWFSMVGKWLLMIAEQFWSARGFWCSINNHRQPNKAAIQNEYTFDPEKCRWWRNRGRVVLSWSATGCWSWFT